MYAAKFVKKMIYKNVGCIFFVLLVLYMPATLHAQQLIASSVDFPVIISEIMADPLPAVHLPSVEYIELLNRSASDLDISGWTMHIGKYETSLPDMILKTQQFYIICDDEVSDSFSIFGNTLPVATMPPVLNTGQVITLRNSLSNIMHSIRFTDAWYKSEHKSGGGWSLEIIDPDNPCAGYENWTASRDKKGGTPGSDNSVSAKNPDLIPPRFIRAGLPSDSSVELIFSEPLNPIQASTIGNFSINNGLYHPESATPVEPHYKGVVLNYPAQFKPGVIYTVYLRDSLVDCIGNKLAAGIGTFGVPALPVVYDIIITEILFESTDGMPEFIEIYNRSDHIIDLASLIISRNDPTGNPAERMAFDDNTWQLLPQNYYILTRNAVLLPENCQTASSERIIECSSFFRLPDEGVLSITDTLLNIIDEVSYSRFMHNKLLRDTRGVALERTDTDPPSNGDGKWSSASSVSGYSTPGMPNSQLICIEHESDFMVYPETISPDDDGYNDVTTIVCRPGEPGWQGNITLFSLEGKTIKTIARNALLGTEEIFVWDGTTNEGKPAEIGIYIVFGELFNSQGKIKKYKKVVSLIRK